jgi:uroporphyrinogen decarboxylase
MTEAQWDTLLAAGTPERVQEATTAMIESLNDRTRLMLSCGGGLPPGAPTANIQAFIHTVTDLTA